MLGKFKTVYAKYKLRYQVIFVNLLISILPIILIAAVFYNIFVSTVEKQVSNSMDLYFNQVDHRLEEYLNTVNIVADSVFLDKQIQELIINKDISYWDKYNDIDDFFQAYLNSYDYVSDIYIMDTSKDIYHSRSVVVKDEIKDFLSAIDSDAINNGRLYIKGPIKTKGGESYFIAYRVIKSVFFDSFLENIAIGAVILDSSKINNIIAENNLPEKSSVFIENQGENIIATTDSSVDINLNEIMAESSGEKHISIGSEKYLLKSSVLNKFDWKIIAVINRNELIKEGNILQYTILLIAVVVFIIVVITTLIFNYQLTFPLKKMADGFDRVAKGDFNYKLKFNYNNEITTIEDNFNNMIKELENLTQSLLQSQEKAHQIELEKKQFQLDGLQSQINAHFLYNSLNTIRVMALTDAKKEVDSMTRNLVSYLRYISNVNEFVTLEEELRQLDKYKNIERLRFGNKFKIKYKIEDGLERLKILKLTIQPVLENSIFHGLRKSSDYGVIQISAFRDKGKAYVRIMDNGMGIRKEDLTTLQDKLNSVTVNNNSFETSSDYDFTEDIVAESSNGNTFENKGIKTANFNNNGRNTNLGIGLVNIHKRIQLYYGEEYGLKVKSWENIGTSVTISYPVDRGGHMNV